MYMYSASIGVINEFNVTVLLCLGLLFSCSFIIYFACSLPVVIADKRCGCRFYVLHSVFTLIIVVIIFVWWLCTL